MQGDGNLVIYYPNGCGNQPNLWNSGTGGHSLANYCVAVGPDGNVVIYTPSNPCGAGASYLTGPHSPSWTQSSNTRPIEGADSWRTSPVIEGRNTCLYVCKSQSVYFRAIDRYSGRQPGWNPAVPNAVSAWNLIDSNSIMWPIASNVLGPDGNDIGSPSPGCPNQSSGYGGLGGGAMCIYGWGD